MFCKKCGKELPNNAKFCVSCGTPVASAGQKNNGSGNSSGFSNSVSKAEPTDLLKKSAMSSTSKKNGKLTVILLIILAILVVAAIAIGILIFKDVFASDSASSSSRVERDRDDETDENDEDDDKAEAEDDENSDESADAESTSTDESDSATEAEQAATEEAAPAEEVPAVVSATNEVVNKVILTDIPKATFAYEFNNDLGNATVVTRQDANTMPVATTITPEYVPGMEGDAVYLDGTCGILLSDIKTLGSSYTVSFWMKADAYCDWSPFFHLGYNQLDSGTRSRLWLCQKTDSKSVSPILSSEKCSTNDIFEIRPAKNSSISVLSPNVWYHVAFTIDGSKRGSRSDSVYGKVYVSGQCVGSGDVVLDTTNSGDLYVYLGFNCWDVPFPVAYDSVKIWNEVLEDWQIEELCEAYY